MRGVLLLLAALGGAASCGTADAELAQKPVRLIVGSAAGGPLDLSARALAAVSERRLREPVVVGNLPGADEVGAMAELARLPADGHTLSLITSAFKGITAQAQRLAFDPDEVRTLLGFAEFRHLLVVKADAPWSAIDQLAAFGRANPGALSFGHEGAGTTTHVQGLLLFRELGVRINAVPFRNSSELTHALIGAQVNMALIDIAGIRALVRAGLLRPLVTVTAQRFAEFAQVPAALELGVAGPQWLNPAIGIAYRRGMPPERIGRLHDALRGAIEDPQFAAALAQIGLKGGYVAPEAYDAGVAAAAAQATPLLQDLGLHRP